MLAKELPLAPFPLEYVDQSTDLESKQNANSERYRRRKEQIAEIQEVAELILREHKLSDEELGNYDPGLGSILVARSYGVEVDLGFGSHREAQLGVTKVASYEERVYRNEITQIDVRLPDGKEAILFKLDKTVGVNVENRGENRLRVANRFGKTASDEDLREALKWLRFIEYYLD